MKDTIINAIKSAIKTNNSQAITGQVLQNVLVNIVNDYYAEMPHIYAGLGSATDGAINQKATTDAINAVDKILMFDGFVDSAQINTSIDPYIGGQIIFVKSSKHFAYYRNSTYTANWNTSESTSVKYQKIVQGTGLVPNSDALFIHGSGIYRWNGSDLVAFIDADKIRNEKGSSTTDLMNQKAITDAIGEVIPEFSIIDSRISIIANTYLNTDGTVVYSTVNKTFAYKVGEQYYSSWPSVYNYLNAGTLTPIQNKLFTCNKKHYLFNGTDLVLLSNEPNNSGSDSSGGSSNINLDGYLYISAAAPSTTPIALTGNEKVFYIATEEGDYTNFGLGNINELSIIKSVLGSWVVEGLGTQNSDIKAIKSTVFIEKEVETVISVELFNGYWQAIDGLRRDDDSSRKSTEKIAVNAGDILRITTRIGASTVIGYLVQWSGSTYKGAADNFIGGSGNAVDREYIVPEGITEIAVCSYNTTEPIVKKITSVFEPKFYTKEEIDNKISNSYLYGVRWKIDDMDDLGERCFDAIGLNAAIGIGSINGHSDFDNIYPWSEIKRCNVNINTNGAKIVTFEGEDGFAVDGSNGDVFVRIPKFRVQVYKEDGYEYRTISQNLGYIHPAFIEQGIELDEVFIAAYEASKDGNPFDDTSGDGKLYSIGGVIPANNIVPQKFLSMAKAKGEQYSLYDMRSVDLLWTLMAVEYGCRNSNRILGYGYSDYIQAATYQTWSIVTIAANATNTVTCGKPSNASERVYILNDFAVGNNICICSNNNQANIIAERKITSVQCASINDNIIITFDGDPIDVDTTCFVGNAPASCNHCESIIGTDVSLSWHTGRTNRYFISGGGNTPDTMNVCRYRWIENPVGNLWHFLPDVSFNNLQMYICRNMKSYEMFKVNEDYKPVGNILPLQESNGEKLDTNTISTPNYWITSLVDDYFAKGVLFGKTFDEIHDGSITSVKGFGAYYYLQNGIRSIANGGGFDHLWRCNILTNRAWINTNSQWYLYGARLIFKNI